MHYRYDVLHSAQNVLSFSIMFAIGHSLKRARFLFSSNLLTRLKLRRTQCVRLMPIRLRLSALLRLATCPRPGLTDGALAALTLRDVDISCQALCLLHVHALTSHTLSNLRAASVGGMADFDIMAADRFWGG